MMSNVENKRIYFFVIFGLMILSATSGCNPQTKQDIEQTSPEIMVGYCPTMEPHVLSLVESHQNVIPVLYENSAAAMEALQAGTVQASLIGRAAWAHELTEGLRVLLIADGLTLIVQQPGYIREEDLPKIRIFTHEEPEAAQSLIPTQTNLVFYEDFEQMISDMDASVAILLRWSQVSPKDSLLVPVDESGIKIPGFRSPHLYYLAAMEETLSPLLTIVQTTP